jgi:hypothetical protein
MTGDVKGNPWIHPNGSLRGSHPLFSRLRVAKKYKKYANKRHGMIELLQKVK